MNQNNRGFLLEKEPQKKLHKIAAGAKRGFIEAKSSQPKAKIKVFKKQTEQMHLALGMFTIENDHDDKHALNLLNIILGGNMSSRLFDEVREKRGNEHLEAIWSTDHSLMDTFFTQPSFRI